MQSFGNSKKVVDYIFWFVLIAFTNPGGILEALGENSSGGGINVSDLLFVILLMCFMSVFKKKIFIQDKSFMKVLNILIIFLIYYIVIFGFFVPQFKDVSSYSIITTLVKMRHGVINIFLVLFVYAFYLRSYKIFFKFFVVSSFIVIVLFLITLFAGIEVLPVKVANRGFVSLNRLIMESYGLMPLLIPMGVVVLVFNFKIENKKLIIITALLMLGTWILSLIRREILTAAILFLLATTLNNYIRRKPLIDLKKMLNLFIYFVIIVTILKFSLPKYYDAVVISIDESIYTIEHGRSTRGYKDARLGFGKVELQEKIKQNYIFGTGFDNNWRVSEEDGYEASDYPFLAAIAMVGIVGLLFFLPIYIQIIKNIYSEIKYLRKFQFNTASFDAYMLILFVIYFIFDLATYVYWFLPVSLFTHGGHKKWYIFFAMYLVTRRIFYTNENIKIKNNLDVRK